MKRLRERISVFFVVCVISLLIEGKTQANGMLLDILCISSSAVAIYEEPDIDANVLEEKKGGEPVYVITSGIPWSTVFCNGEKGYVLTENLVPADYEKLVEDEAFDEEALLNEYEESLSAAYKAEMDEHRERKLFVVSIAVIIAAVFAVADIVVVKKYKEKKEAKEKEDGQNV